MAKSISPVGVERAHQSRDAVQNEAQVVRRADCGHGRIQPRRGDHASFRRGCNLKDPSDARVLRQCACRSRRQHGDHTRQHPHFSEQIATRIAGPRRAPSMADASVERRWRDELVHDEGRHEDPLSGPVGCRDWSVVRVGPRARRPTRGPGHVAGADRPQRGPVGRGGARRSAALLPG